MVPVDNYSMTAINQHCESMIQIMSDADLTLIDLRKIQMRFKQFDALIENLINEINEEVLKVKDPDNKVTKFEDVVAKNPEGKVQG